MQSSGVRWADMTRASCGTPKAASCATACCMISQSLALPMTTPTLGALLCRAIIFPRSAALRLRRGVSRRCRFYHRPRVRHANAPGADLSDGERSLTMLPMSWSLLRSSAGRRAAAALATACIALAARGQPSDADFVLARDAYRAGDAARLEHIAPRLAG